MFFVFQDGFVWFEFSFFFSLHFTLNPIFLLEQGEKVIYEA